MTAWETVSVPEGITVQAIEPFRDKVVILDGLAGTMYLMEPDGSVLLSWAAPGDGHETGDIAVDHNASFVTLGAGERYFEFFPEVLE